MTKKAKPVVINALVLLLSIIIIFALLEGTCRIVFNPVDYLPPELSNDTILRHRIIPNTGGHDEWGFRNKEVPQNCDIATLGGSNTYGQNALKKYSWPSQLGRLTDSEIYNLGTLGYSPPQNLYNLITKASALKPKYVICDFALGGNIYATYKTIYGLSSWSGLRDSLFEASHDKVEGVNMTFEDQTNGLMRSLNRWIKTKSIIYNIALNNTILHSLCNQKQMTQDNAEGNCTLDIPEKNISQGFQVAYRFGTQDLEKDENKEGLRLCLKLYHIMNKYCQKNNIELYILMIPSKESVFASYIEHNDTIKNSNLIDLMLKNERNVSAISKEFFDTNNINYIDILPSLTAQTENNIYSKNFDGHPNKDGYAVIAKCIANALTPQKND